MGEKTACSLKLFYIKWLQNPPVALENTSIRKTLGMTEQRKGKGMKLDVLCYSVFIRQVPYLVQKSSTCPSKEKVWKKNQQGWKYSFSGTEIFDYFMKSKQD